MMCEHECTTTDFVKKHPEYEGWYWARIACDLSDKLAAAKAELAELQQNHDALIKSYGELHEKYQHDLCKEHSRAEQAEAQLKITIRQLAYQGDCPPDPKITYECNDDCDSCWMLWVQKKSSGENKELYDGLKYWRERTATAEKTCNEFAELLNTKQAKLEQAEARAEKAEAQCNEMEVVNTDLQARVKRMEDALKKAQHELVTSGHLWATDRKDLIIDRDDVLFEIDHDAALKVIEAALEVPK